ncbi:hypothetical protein SAMN04489812_5451 [Microlunatus soli]|uniref:Uncharacterized protein n=1 Tax=Microlunatus soli TaxID=630515 RepID=A0A1H1ZU07_9ACTN|nr:hypothetical protein SAMN04489812_5451 [Microlunatus soli]
MAFVGQLAVSMLGGGLLLLAVIVIARSVRVGALGRWGFGLVVAGLIAHLVGTVLGAVGAGLASVAHSVVGVVSGPVWMLAHLGYIGTTLVGIAAWRAGSVPRPVAVALITCAPVVLVGVPAGLALASAAGTVVSDSVAWVATELQFGLVWLLVGVVRSRPTVGSPAEVPVG